MKNLKVVKVFEESIVFDNGLILASRHDKECCEYHWLDFSVFTIKDFEGLEFDLTNDNFFERINGFGIALKPSNGHPIRVAGYGSNNGYYTNELELLLSGKDYKKVYDITECQDFKYDSEF